MSPNMSYIECLGYCRLLSLEKQHEYLDYNMVYCLKKAGANRVTFSNFDMKEVKSKKNKHNLMQPWPGNKHNQHDFSLHVISGWNRLPEGIKDIDGQAKFQNVLICYLHSNV